MLLKISGKECSADEISQVIAAGGGEADSDAIATLLADLEGKDVEELLSSGMAKLKDVVMGGGGGGGGGGAGGAAGPAVDAPAAAAKEEEKEEEEEMDLGGGMDMFGDGGGEGGGDY